MSTTLSAIPTAISMPEGALDAAVAWHYGDPLGEQRMLASGRGSVDMSHRGVITVKGPERLSFLNSLTTQALLDLAPSQSALTLNLTINGFVEHELHLVDDGETLWITCEQQSTADLLKYLLKMRFRLELEITDVTEDWACIWQPNSVAHEKYLTFISPFSWPSRGILVPRVDAVEIVAQAPAGMWAYEALRIAALVPRQDRETDHHTIPHEVNWLESGVHLNKGCYRGQETVSKVYRMGKPPRRLTMLHLDGSQDVLPLHGTEVMSGDAVVGFIGASAQHYELGPIASAVVKRNLDPAAVVTVLGQQASQETDLPV